MSTDITLSFFPVMDRRDAPASIVDCHGDRMDHQTEYIGFRILIILIRTRPCNIIFRTSTILLLLPYSMNNVPDHKYKTNVQEAVKTFAQKLTSGMVLFTSGAFQALQSLHVIFFTYSFVRKCCPGS